MEIPQNIFRYAAGQRYQSHSREYHLDALDCYMARYKLSFDMGNAKNRKVSTEYARASGRYHDLRKSCEAKWATATPEERAAMDR